MAGLNHSASEYLQALKFLLPPGPAWQLDDNCFFVKMLELASREFARIDEDIEALIKESDPRTASVTLNQWFKEWGIPDDCLKAYSEATLEDYRNVLVTKYVTQGYTFSELVALIGKTLGYSDVSINNFKIFKVNSRVNERVYSPKWSNWFMAITVNKVNERKFLTTSRVSERLSKWGDTLFECLVKTLAPCHTDVIFQYGDNE